jgi:hypothetical protein
MKRIFSARTFAAAALALGAVGVASAAHAGTDVILSIGVNAPYGYGYVQPAPVYVAPQPVYMQPRPVYVQPQAMYWRHDRRIDRSGPYGDSDHDGIQNRFDRNSRYYDVRLAQRHDGRGDADHDGVRNRYDRAPNNPYRY